MKDPRLKLELTPSLHFCLRAPVKIGVLTRGPWRLLPNTLCCVENVNHLGLIQNTLSAIYGFAIDLVLLIKYSF